MGSREQLEFLEREIADRIIGARNREDYYRSRAIAFAIGGAALSGMTTLLVAVDEIFPGWYLQVGALVTSGLVTFLASVGAWMSYRDLWLQSNTTRMRFYELQSDIEFDRLGQDDAKPSADMGRYYDRYKSILEQTNEAWINTRRNQAFESSSGPQR